MRGGGGHLEGVKQVTRHVHASILTRHYAGSLAWAAATSSARKKAVCYEQGRGRRTRRREIVEATTHERNILRR